MLQLEGLGIATVKPELGGWIPLLSAAADLVSCAAADGKKRSHCKQGALVCHILSPAAGRLVAFQQSEPLEHAVKVFRHVWQSSECWLPLADLLSAVLHPA